MNRGRTDHPKGRQRQATMPVAVLVVMIATGLPITAAAERNDSRPPDSQALNPQPLESQGRTQAPIGHRQPRPQDLPPSVLREEEGAGRQRQDSGAGGFRQGAADLQGC